jgi:hypothetical protein
LGGFPLSLQLLLPLRFRLTLPGRLLLALLFRPLLGRLRLALHRLNLPGLDRLRRRFGLLRLLDRARRRCGLMRLFRVAASFLRLSLGVQLLSRCWLRGLRRWLSRLLPLRRLRLRPPLRFLLLLHSLALSSFPLDVLGSLRFCRCRLRVRLSLLRRLRLASLPLDRSRGLGFSPLNLARAGGRR